MLQMIHKKNNNLTRLIDKKEHTLLNSCCCVYITKNRFYFNKAVTHNLKYTLKIYHHF